MNAQGVVFLALIFILVILLIKEILKYRRLKTELENANVTMEDMRAGLAELQARLSNEETQKKELESGIRLSNQKIVDYELKYGDF
ncbi:MAG TPA: hypothetical protein VG890_04820, partial [Puia sp.]|nr:hypothetical protein [Puia sp.]